MRVVFFIFMTIYCLNAETVLVINSNSDVKKYTETVEEFSETFNKPFKTLDISHKNSKEIKKYLYDEYPDIVYAVGAKAYQYANEYIPEKEIYFSSIVDWKKLSPKNRRYGISNELHSGMQLMLAKSIFTNIKSIGIVHSKYTQNILNDLRQDAAILGISILTLKVDEESVNTVNYEDMLNQCDAVMIVPDPLFIKNENAVKNLFSLSKEYKKPIIAYHELFIKYGATLVISADNPTIGRQMATMIDNRLNGESIEKIQYPAGTNIVLNKKEAAQIGVEFPPEISSIATEVIE